MPRFSNNLLNLFPEFRLQETLHQTLNLHEIFNEQNHIQKIIDEQFSTPTLDIINKHYQILNTLEEQCQALDIFKEQHRAFDIIHKQIHALNAISEQCRFLENFNRQHFPPNNVQGLAEKIIATEASLAGQHPLQGGIQELAEKMAATETSLIRTLHPFAMETTRLFHFCEQLCLSTQSLEKFHLSDTTLKLIKISKLLRDHNIIIPLITIDIVNSWLDEKSDYIGETHTPTTKSAERNLNLKKLIMYNLLGGAGLALTLFDIVKNYDIKEEIAEEVNRIVVNEIQDEVKAQNERIESLIDELENNLAKEKEEERSVFLSTVREEIRRIFREEYTKPDDEENKMNRTGAPTKLDD